MKRTFGVGEETFMQNKRQHVEGTPSKVLHVRGLPQGTNDMDLVTLCCTSGQVMKSLILAEKNQAFIEMDSVQSAANVLAQYEGGTAFIRNKPIVFQYSSRQAITSNQARSTNMNEGPESTNSISSCRSSTNLCPSLWTTSTQFSAPTEMS